MIFMTTEHKVIGGIGLLTFVILIGGIWLLSAQGSKEQTKLEKPLKGLLQSSDGGKTFTQASAIGIMSGMEVMNFAYDPKTKTLFAGGHDLGLVKSVDKVIYPSIYLIYLNKSSDNYVY